MCSKRKAISDCLKELGYNLMASHALTEQNFEIVKGYVRLIEYKATLNNQQWMFERLEFAGIHSEEVAYA